MGASSWRAKCSAVLFSRPSAAIAAAVTALIFLGCMSLNLGGRTYESHTCDSPGEDGLFLQQGEVQLKGKGQQDVYYPVPFAHPPNLQTGWA